MSDLREKVARALFDATPFREIAGPLEKQSEIYQRHARNQADAAIAVCMEEAAPLIEAAFKEGLLRADGLTNPDLAWKNSEVAAALRALRGEGGVDG